MEPEFPINFDQGSPGGKTPRHPSCKLPLQPRHDSSAILLGSKGQAASDNEGLRIADVEKKSVAVEHNVTKAVIPSQVLTISEVLESWI